MAAAVFRNRHSRAWQAAALTVVGLLALAGCSAQASLPESVPDVRAVKLDRAVYEPVWSRSRGLLLALVHQQPRVAKINPTAAGPPRFTMSAPLGGVGENIALSPTDQGAVFVPQPDRGRIAALDLPSLEQRDTLELGHAPSQVSIDSGSKVLLALSEDGTTITGADLRDNTTLPVHKAPAGPRSEVEGPKRGRLIDYHVVGPKGIFHYKGPQGGVEKRAELRLPVSASATDEVKASRIYVAEKGTNKLHAVDTHRWHVGMEVVATARLNEPITELASDEVRIFAATEHRLVVLESNSFEGFSNGTFDVVERIDYRRALPTERLKHTPLSGIAVGADRVYLTLDGAPYLVSVAKPAI